MAHVTFVDSPLGSRLNSTTLWASNGFRKSSLSFTLAGGTDSAISIRPSPTSRLPSHAYTAPLPLVTAPKVRFIAGSFFSHGDHASQRLKSLMSAKTFSGGALMLAERCTRNVSGLVAAKMSTPATSARTMTPMVLIMNSSPYWLLHVVLD